MHVTRNVICFLVSILTALTLLAPASARAEALTYSNSESFPLTFYLYDGCSNEWVYVSGTLHANYHVTINSNSYHVEVEYNPQGVTGLGLNSGRTYHGTGVTRYSFDSGPGLTISYVDNFRFITAGPNNNYMVHDNFHLTINANGTVTSVVDNFSWGCR